jgi:hypothetical protein
VSKKFRRDKGLDSTISTVESYIFPAQLNAFLFLEVFGDQTTFYQAGSLKPHPLVWQRYSTTHASVTDIELVIAAKALVVKYQRKSYEMEDMNT